MEIFTGAYMYIFIDPYNEFVDSCTLLYVPQFNKAKRKERHIGLDKNFKTRRPHKGHWV